MRRINLVYWNDEAAARELKSSDEVMAALRAGEIRIERPGVIVNMPMLTWPGGKRYCGAGAAAADSAVPLLTQLRAKWLACHLSRRDALWGKGLCHPNGLPRDHRTHC